MLGTLAMILGSGHSDARDPGCHPEERSDEGSLAFEPPARAVEGSFASLGMTGPFASLRMTSSRLRHCFRVYTNSLVSSFPPEREVHDWRK